MQTSKGFPHQTGKIFLLDAGFVHQGIVTIKQEFSQTFMASIKTHTILTTAKKKVGKINM